VHQEHGVFEAERLRGHEGRVLAQAVARGQIRLHPEELERDAADDQQRGLCVLSELELILRAFETQSRDLISQDLVGPGKHLPGQRRFLIKRQAHPDFL